VAVQLPSEASLNGTIDFADFADDADMRGKPRKCVLRMEWMKRMNAGQGRRISRGVPPCKGDEAVAFSRLRRDVPFAACPGLEPGWRFTPPSEASTDHIINA
jgi:hypothetical protein